MRLRNLLAIVLAALPIAAFIAVVTGNPTADRLLMGAFGALCMVAAFFISILISGIEAVRLKKIWLALPFLLLLISLAASLDDASDSTVLIGVAAMILAGAAMPFVLSRWGRSSGWYAGLFLVLAFELFILRSVWMWMSL